jgi:hypothetical protein
MAGPRNNGALDDVGAQDLVFENLGLSSDDLGIQGDDVQDEQVDIPDDLPDESEDPFSVDEPSDLEDLRVTHTDDRSQQRQQRPLPQKAGVKPDARGNLVDTKTNKIVARAGAEARFYLSREKVRQQLTARDVELRSTAGRLSRVTQIAQTLKEQNDALRAAQGRVEQLGFTPDDQVAAMQLYSQLKKDAKGTLTRLLTRAAANGIVVDGSQSQSAPAVADIVKETLGQELKPLKEFVTAQQADAQRRREAQAMQQEVQQEVEDFFASNPDAGPHARVFQRLLRDPRYNKMSLGEMWARIQLNLATSQRTRGRQRPTPQRRGSPPNGRGTPPMDVSPMANVNESFDSILNGLLDEHGV